MKTFFFIPFLFVNLFLLRPLQAQNPEVFLNQGELSNNSILVESKRILISFDSQIAFWDIDRSLLLKSYGAGNQFTSGQVQTQSPVALSAQGNMLACSTPDSICIYKVTTQNKIKTLPFKRVEMGYSYCNFTADEQYFIALSAPPHGRPGPADMAYRYLATA